VSLQQLHAHSHHHATHSHITLSFHSLCSLFNNNNIGDAGAEALAAALKDNTTLTLLK